MTREKKKPIKRFFDLIANIGLLQMLFIPFILSGANEITFKLILSVGFSCLYAYTSGRWLGEIEE